MSIPLMSTEDLRRKLAGLSDPDRSSGTIAEGVELKEVSCRLCCVLAYLFGEELDRKTLWARIASGIAAGCAKVDDGDLDRFASLCLDHVQADAAKVAACDPLGQILATFAVRPIEWRQALVRYLRTHGYSVIVHARARWELVKKKEVEL
jgi:hypothetical protein